MLEANASLTIDDIAASITCAATRGIIAGNNDSTTANRLLHVPAAGIPLTPAGAVCADRQCVGGCGSGQCVDGWCKCPCFSTGQQCQHNVSLAGTLTGLNGSLVASNANRASNFGQVCIAHSLALACY